jgi:hypothetical protein
VTPPSLTNCTGSAVTASLPGGSVRPSRHREYDGQLRGSSFTTGRPLIRCCANRRAACCLVWFSVTVITLVVITSLACVYFIFSSQWCMRPFLPVGGALTPAQDGGRRKRPHPTSAPLPPLRDEPIMVRVNERFVLPIPPGYVAHALLLRDSTRCLRWQMGRK